MKKAIYLGVCLGLSLSLNAQTMVSFKPGPTIGEDALLWQLVDSCVPSNLPVTPGDVNFGNERELGISTWTYYGRDCDEGSRRSVIRFTELSTIPSYASIQSATLVLKTPPSGYVWDGNNYYPSTPYNSPNPGWVKLIKSGATYAWDEQTVTWNNFIPLNPVNTSIPPVEIPETQSEYNWVSQMDVTAMVQQMFTDRTSTANWNNGFLLELQTEEYYRSQIFGSSDNAHTASWPELIVTYSTCDPSFAFCSNTNSPYTYTFTANDPNLNNYEWFLNGVLMASGSPSFNLYNAGYYEICLKVYNEESDCEKCIMICTGDNPEGLLVMNDSVAEDTKARPLQYPASRGDDISIIKKTGLQISPNPAKNGWNLQLNVPTQGDVSITISDIAGKTIHSSSKNLTKGINTIYQDATNLANGVYFISIQSKDGINYNERVVKK